MQMPLNISKQKNDNFFEQVFKIIFSLSSQDPFKSWAQLINTAKATSKTTFKGATLLTEDLFPGRFFSLFIFSVQSKL
jgi:hypothetical protein